MTVHSWSFIHSDDDRVDTTDVITTNNILVYMDEELEPNIILAYVNYDGKFMELRCK